MRIKDTLKGSLTGVCALAHESREKRSSLSGGGVGGVLLNGPHPGCSPVGDPGGDLLRRHGVGDAVTLGEVAAQLDQQVALGIFRGARQGYIEKSVECRPGFRRNKQPKPPVHQAGALLAEQRRAGVVDLLDDAVGGERKITRGRKVVEIGVAFQTLFKLGARLQQGLILQLQLDLVDLEFVDEPQSLDRRRR